MNIKKLVNIPEWMWSTFDSVDISIRVETIKTRRGWRRGKEVLSLVYNTSHGVHVEPVRTIKLKIKKELLIFLLNSKEHDLKYGPIYNLNSNGDLKLLDGPGLMEQLRRSSMTLYDVTRSGRVQPIRRIT